MAKITERQISDYQQDPANANAGTERGVYMLDTSLERFGAGRSILVDKNGVIIAGNKTGERAADLGITDVIEVETDGKQLVVVKRIDLDLLKDDEHKARGLAYADNRAGEVGLAWDAEQLLSDIQAGVSLDAFWKPEELEELLQGLYSQVSNPVSRATLQDQFGVPPFSVLDARQGYWQERKRQWLALGIQSELGRGGYLDETGHAALHDSAEFSSPLARKRGQYDKPDNGLLGNSEQARSHYRVSPGGSPRPATRLVGGHTIRGTGNGKALAPGGSLETATHIGSSGKFERADLHARAKDFGTEGNIANEQTGTSIFDPVLCELAYRWFCPPDGKVIDPFAGGSVRGIVAGVLGRKYIGINLSARQVEANRAQAEAIATLSAPQWFEGDSHNLLDFVNQEVDFVFTCPPYFDLEVYSDDPADLSVGGDYEAFVSAYRDIIKLACGLLADNRFACITVGDIRDKKGIYRNFVSDTIAAFLAAGMFYYNEAILVTAVGSLPIRVRKAFESSRKLGKTHQNVLVFCKGNPRKAAEAVGRVDVGEWSPEMVARLIANSEGTVS